MKPEISLLKGSYWNYLNPEESVYTLRDIARALSRESRFNGATEGNLGYSVAQHAVYVSLLNNTLESLHHDDTEFVMKDLPKPLKNILPGYSNIEKNNEKAIFKKLGLKWPLDKSIKRDDNRLLVAEKEDLQGETNIVGYENVERAPFKIVPWSAAKAEREFLKRHFELGGKEF